MAHARSRAAAHEHAVTMGHDHFSALWRTDVRIAQTGRCLNPVRAATFPILWWIGRVQGEQHIARHPEARSMLILPIEHRLSELATNTPVGLSDLG